MAIANSFFHRSLYKISISRIFQLSWKISHTGLEGSCKLFSSLCIRHNCLYHKLSHFNKLLWNYRTIFNQSLVEWSLIVYETSTHIPIWLLILKKKWKKINISSETTKKILTKLAWSVLGWSSLQIMSDRSAHLQIWQPWLKIEIFIFNISSETKLAWKDLGWSYLKKLCQKRPPTFKYDSHC